MEKNIYSVYVPMENQEQCDRMKQLCIDNGLPTWEYYTYYNNSIFTSDNLDNDFWVMIAPNNIERYSRIKTKVTESEFIDLLKKHKL